MPVGVLLSSLTFDGLICPLSFVLSINNGQGSIDYGYVTGNWSVQNFDNGDYEAVLRAVCKPVALTFPPPGYNDFFSASIKGSVRLIDPYRVIASSNPANHSV